MNIRTDDAVVDDIEKQQQQEQEAVEEGQNLRRRQLNLPNSA